jgi:chemotaxis protein methyltransferase CheR
MVLREYQARHQDFQFAILATDISTKVLEKAALGIYEEERVEPVPMSLRHKYLMRSKDRSRMLVRIVPELRSLVSFRRMNLMDDDYGIRTPMDVIFCRNVIIYFEKSVQEAVLSRLCSCLIPGGYLFTGHSETLSGMDLPLIAEATTVYKKTR